MFEGFADERIDTGAATLRVRHGGSGPAVLLLHGHPRTGATWHRTAPLLVAAGYTVICPDLRGYGSSSAPAPQPDHAQASKRAMADDLRHVMRALGHPVFHLAGHDRGSYVALRLALDAPGAVRRVALLDCVPISEALRRCDERFAAAWWHWFFFAQPDIPERVITADPDTWYGAWTHNAPDRLGPANHAEFLAAIRDPATVRAMLEDYRAGLGVDRAHEEADRAAGRRVTCPLLLLWSLRDDLEYLYGDPRAVWRDWAEDVRGYGIDSGHHLAEEAPAELGTALAAFFAEPGPPRAVLAPGSGGVQQA